MELLDAPSGNYRFYTRSDDGVRLYLDGALVIDNPGVDQVLSIYAGTRGYMDKVPITEVTKWEAAYLQFIREQKHEIWQDIDQSRDITDFDRSSGRSPKLDAAIAEFIPQYAGKRKEEEATAAV